MCAIPSQARLHWCSCRSCSNWAAAERAVVIQKHEGDKIPPLDTVADCVSGYVLATGSSREDAVRIGDELVEAVHFIVDPTA